MLKLAYQYVQQIAWIGGDCVKSIDHFEENWHLHKLEYSNLPPAYPFI